MTDLCVSFVFPNDIPVVGDWNADSSTEIGVFRNGTWALDLNGNGIWNGQAPDGIFTFGLPTDKPVTGIW
jgi:hypothetical protein